MKNKKLGKVLSCILAFMLVAGMIPGTAITAFAADEVPCTSTEGCDGYYNNGFCNDCEGYQPAVDSDSDGFYEIENAGQLYWLAQTVNTGTNTDIDVILLNDITVNDGVLVDGVLTDMESSLTPWTPIGEYSVLCDDGYYRNFYYGGEFNGNGKTISGLYCPSDGLDYKGFFGIVDYDGNIYDLTISESYFGGGYDIGGIAGVNQGTISNCRNEAYVKGSNSTGGIAGGSKGTISDCVNTGTVEGSSYSGGIVGSNGNCNILRCNNTGAVTGDSYVGGIAGSNKQLISDCVNSGTVTGGTYGSEIGGIVGGDATGEITRCNNTAAVTGGTCVGGIVGSSQAVIKNCYNTASINSDGKYTGGIAGEVTTGSSAISNCYNIGNVTATTGGGIAGGNQGSITNSYYLQTDSINARLFPNNTFDYWSIDPVGAASLQDFNSGKITYLLQSGNEEQVWGQSLKESALDLDYDEYPVYSDVKVYATSPCPSQFANTSLEDEVVEHNFVDGICSACGALSDLPLNEDGFYEIGNVGQLYKFAELVSEGNITINAKLVNDIVINENVLTDGELSENSSDFLDWDPIKSDTNSLYPYFKGEFDGNNKVIYGLFNIDNRNSALFAGLSQGGYIHNLGIEDSYFESENNYMVSSIVANNYGTIENCYSTATVKGEEVVAGIVASNEATVNNCFFAGSVVGATGDVENFYLGAIVGSNDVDSVLINNYYLENCAVDCNGIVQAGTGSADSSTPNEDIEGQTKSATEEEFISGRVWYYLQKNTDDGIWGQDLKTSESDTDYDKYPVLGGEKVYISTPCPTEYSNTPFTEDTTEHTYNDKGYCSFCNVQQPTDTNAEGFYEIYNAGQLFHFAELVNSGATTIKGKLMADITVNEALYKENGSLLDEEDLKAWTPIGSETVKFEGEFDGNGKKIINLYLNDTEAYYVGLFGYVNNASIYDVTIKDSYISGYQYVGSIAGYAKGSNIKNCVNESKIICSQKYVGGILGYAFDCTIENCSNKKSINYGTEYIGGIAGYVDKSTVNNCTNNADIQSTYSTQGGIAGHSQNSTVANCFNTGNIGNDDSYANIGGIIGYASTTSTDYGATVVSCYNTGIITGDIYVGGIIGSSSYSGIEKSYNTGAVYGSEYVGGLAGDSSGTINNSYNIATVSGTDYVGGLAGLKTYKSITNCYNMGKVSASGVAGGIAGDNSNLSLNCFYLKTDSINTNLDAEGNRADKQTMTEAKPLSAFTTGEIAYRLEENNDDLVWGQNFKESDSDTEYDEYPVLGGATVYATTPCYSGYSNQSLESSTKAHTFENGFCTECGALDKPNLNADGFYEISNAGQLYWFSVKVNSGKKDLKGKLINSIVVNNNVLSGGELVADTTNLREWFPIGNEDYAFEGEFDGNGQQIKGLYYNRPEFSYAGLFGHTLNSAKIYDITLSNSYIRANEYVAGIVGDASNTNITNCINNSVIYGSSSVGGVVGSAANNSVSITYCKNRNTIYGKHHVGGIVGNNYADISICSNTGAVTSCDSSEATSAYMGGIAGTSAKDIIDCYNTGDITYISGGTYVGGICGSASGKVIRCYNMGNITGGGVIGGIAGGSYDAIEDCYNTGDINSSGDYAGGIFGENSSSETEIIKNCYNKGVITGKYYTGGIAGNSLHSIINCYNINAISGNNYTGGIVGNISGSSSKIEKCYSTASTSGATYVGGVAGYNNGATVNNCYNIADVKGRAKLGGVVGENTATITNSYNIGSVSGRSSSIEGYIGGITGKNTGTIAGCYYLENCAVTYNGTVQNGVGLNSVSTSATDVAGQTTSVTSGQITSGEVAHALQNANTEMTWGQASNMPGAYPILTDKEVYKVVTVGETGNYSVSSVGDTNYDETVDVTDYQALVNKILSDDHEEIETASYGDIIRYDIVSDGYLDVLDAALMHLFINGFKTVDVYPLGDYNLNNVAFEEADLGAIKHALSNTSKLSTAEKHASDIDGDGIFTIDDIDALEAMYGEITGTDCEDYIEVIYTWGKDYATCSATAMCSVCNKLFETEIVNATREQISTQSCTTDGVVRYTATFTKEHLGERVLEIVDEATGHNFVDNKCICGLTLIYVDSAVVYDDYPFDWNDENTGKTAWENGDKVLMIMDSPFYGQSHIELEYQDGNWVYDFDDVGYLELEDVKLSAIYAPDYNAVNGEFVLKDGAVPGTADYIEVPCEIDYDQFNVYIESATINYSRLRIAGEAGTTYTVDVTGFTPAGCTEQGAYNYTLQSDSDGNMFLYGTFAEGATVVVKKDGLSLAEKTFETATEAGKGYAMATRFSYSYDTETNTYTVYDSDGFYYVAGLVNGGQTTINITLANDIVVNENVLNTDGTLNSDTSAFREWTPIGNTSYQYAGTLDGANHTISGLYYNGYESYKGLVGCLGETGTVKNVSVEDSYFNTGSYYGGIVGNNYGTVENCSFDGSINGYECVGGIAGRNYGIVKNSHNIGSIYGNRYDVGGVVGENNATVENCYNTGDVSNDFRFTGGIAGTLSGNTSSVKNCYNTGNVTSSESAGGVVGNKDSGSVENCHNTGVITITSKSGYAGGVVGDDSDGTIKDCYNEGNIFAAGTNAYIGGVVACTYGTVTNCYNIGDISTSGKYVGGVAGYSDADINKCYNSGTITCAGDSAYIGGVSGRNNDDNNGTISNSYNIGNIVSNGTNCQVGGVAGYNYSVVQNCYSTGSITATSGNIGGVIGQIVDGSITNCYYDATKYSGNSCGYKYGGTLSVYGKSTTEFATADMATLLNADQTDAPWEYIAGKPAPTFK